MTATDPEIREPDGPEADAPAGSGAGLAARLATALSEKEEAQRNWQRALADYQNLRRRQQGDVEDAVRRGKAALLAELLLVLDYLDLALQAPCTTPEARALHAGVELTRQQMWRALEREGVAVVPESGAFDAALHECVARVETGDRPAGEIVAVLRSGYSWNGSVLRAAQVQVAAEKLS